MGAIGLKFARALGRQADRGGRLAPLTAQGCSIRGFLCLARIERCNLGGFRRVRATLGEHPLDLRAALGEVPLDVFRNVFQSEVIFRICLDRITERAELLGELGAVGRPECHLPLVEGFVSSVP